MATAVRTPPFNIVLSEVDDTDALDAVADAYATVDVPGLSGPAEHAAECSALWSERSGRGHRLAMAERIHRLTAVIRPPHVRGVLRAAVRTDRDVLDAWLRKFELEALGKEIPPDAPTTVDRWLSGRGRTMYVWDDGGPVSMCGVGGSTPHGSRIGPVYTPRELRGHGYATAAVAAVSQVQLDSGRRYCFLFTDVANETSNRIYAAVGYEPVRDISRYSFERAAAAERAAESAAPPGAGE
ncbi:MAG TPA: GNAT family N-acetyltransferase [Candidatus Limnocylindrales bacterium]